MEAAVAPPMAAAPSAAGTSSQEAGEERVELGEAILRDIDRDLLVGGCGWG
jgi:hypothetical protein